MKKNANIFDNDHPKEDVRVVFSHEAQGLTRGFRQPPWSTDTVLSDYLPKAQAAVVRPWSDRKKLVAVFAARYSVLEYDAQDFTKVHFFMKVCVCGCLGRRCGSVRCMGVGREVCFESVEVVVATIATTCTQGLLRSGRELVADDLLACERCSAPSCRCAGRCVVLGPCCVVLCLIACMCVCRCRWCVPWVVLIWRLRVVCGAVCHRVLPRCFFYWSAVVRCVVRCIGGLLWCVESVWLYVCLRRASGLPLLVVSEACMFCPS